MHPLLPFKKDEKNVPVFLCTSFPAPAFSSFLMFLAACLCAMIPLPQAHASMDAFTDVLQPQDEPSQRKQQHKKKPASMPSSTQGREAASGKAKSTNPFDTSNPFAVPPSHGEAETAEEEDDDFYDDEDEDESDINASSTSTNNRRTSVVSGVYTSGDLRRDSCCFALPVAFFFSSFITDP